MPVIRHVHQTDDTTSITANDVRIVKYNNHTYYKASRMAVTANAKTATVRAAYVSYSWVQGNRATLARLTLVVMLVVGASLVLSVDWAVIGILPEGYRLISDWSSHHPVN